MKKRYVNLILAMVSASAMVLGSVPAMATTDSAKTESAKNDSKEDAEASNEKEADAAKTDTLEDGVYTAEFDTDSSMFHVNEANDKKGKLTVKDGKMTIHVSLVSKKIVNLFAGTAEDAQKDGAEIIEPTTDTVKYSDGYTEEVYGFDIPVPAIGEEFDVALLGEKGKWYDHKVSVKDPVKTDDTAEEAAEDSDKKDEASDKETTEKSDASKDDKKSEGKKLEDLKLEDGTYEFDVTLTGGTGRATVESPAKVEIKDKEATATIIWSSPNYDYMIVDGEKYEPVNKDGNSTFEIPVTVFDTEMEVTADTVAMSTPHEIDYTLNFDSSSMKKEEK
ncbi:hypothetical protein [Blautia sp. MSJ-36]|uniref:hypothetical protein n=1 Tax=Blautia sp. MSJ-36 TaxID=2841530 RepID=UPI001C0FD4BD|nr:hypothetical protein [Blautia sp. MSJ-36]MBU5446604.1 hypothetical protein [Blautia sp. MSJ-36]